MRVLHFISALSGGGAERQLGLLARTQRDLGHQVGVAYLSEGPQPPSGDEAAGIEFLRLEVGGNYSPGLLPGAARILRTFRPDVAQTWITQMDVAAGSVAAILGIPWIVREPSSSPSSYRQFRNRLRQLCAKRATAVVANSAEGLALWKGSPIPLKALIPNGLDLSQIDATLAYPRSSFPSDGPVVVAASRLDPVKNIRTLVEAFVGSARTNMATYVICGDGPERTWIEDRIRSSGMEERVLLLGHTRDPWSYMKSADVFISLSSREGCPNAVLEAMSCSCPLILSDIPGHRAVADGDNAFFVSTSDQQAAIAAISSVLSNSQTRASMRIASRQKSRAFSIDVAARSYTDIYERMIAVNRTASRSGAMGR